MRNFVDIYVKLIRNLGNFIYVIFSSTKKKYILLHSCLNGPISGDILYLYNYLKKRGCSYKIMFLTSDPRKIQKDVIWINSLNYYYYLAKSRLVITNGHVQYYGNHKSKDTLFIDIWHGTPLKACMSAVKYNTYEEFNTIKNYEKNSDYHLSGSKYFEEEYLLNSYKYSHKILKYGFFRNDCLIQNDDHNIKFEFPNNKINILFAPTWPEFDIKETVNEFKLIVNKLSEEFPDSNIIVRMHHLILEDMNFDKLNNVYDESETIYIQELLLHVDILITDYSSLLFDFALLRRPIFLYQKEPKKVDEFRGLYILDCNLELGIPVFDDINKLINAIKQVDLISWEEVYKQYDNRIRNYETGKSLEMFYDKFLGDKYE